jgi:hypothetical protein
VLGVTFALPLRQARPVAVSLAAISSGVPENKMLPPCGPAPGPISTTWSHRSTMQI